MMLLSILEAFLDGRSVCGCCGALWQLPGFLNNSNPGHQHCEVQLCLRLFYTWIGRREHCSWKCEKQERRREQTCRKFQVGSSLWGDVVGQLQLCFWAGPSAGRVHHEHPDVIPVKAACFEPPNVPQHQRVLGLGRALYLRRSTNTALMCGHVPHIR